VSGDYYAVDAVEHPDGRITALIRYNFQTENTNLLQMDHNGNVLWHKTVDNGGLFLRAHRLLRTDDDGFLISVTNNATYEKQLYKTDPDGNVQFIYNPEDNTGNYHLRSFKQLPDHQFEAVYQISGGNMLDVIRLSEQGAVTAQDTFEFPNHYGDIKVMEADLHHYLSISGNGQITNFYATLFDDQGQMIWQKPLGIPYANPNIFKDAVVLTDGGFVMVRNIGNNCVFNRFDSQGDPVWQRTFNAELPNIFKMGAITAASDGGILAAALTYYYGNDLDVLAYYITSDGKTRLNMLEGAVAQDVNQNCVAQFPEEPPLANWLIEVQKPGDTILFNTYNNGFYRTFVDTGTYQIRPVPINDLWVSCPVQATITNTTDQLFFHQQDFAIQPLVLCPRMEVDITAPFLRRCFPGTYFIHCQNAGTKIADDVQVAIVLDPYLSYDTASVALAAQQGDTLYFDLGPLDVGESSSFSLTFTVDCDSTVIGQTHCTKAIAFPNEFCSSVNAAWSGASLDMSGKCMGDSVTFTIRNNGLGNMTAPQEAYLLRNGTLDSTFVYQLVTNETFSVMAPADGSTWRLQTLQVTDHPYYGIISSTIEGCVADAGQDFATGFVTQFPTEDVLPYVAVDCRRNIGSFDPNDKSVQPEGRGDEHLVSPDTDLEYLIRFQNTGTDTAFQVVVRDTLSFALDPYSIIPGASSHPYVWGFDSPRSVYFSFSNIMLPDSNVNEPASHGFISYRIRQRAGNQSGTYIQNRAGIYFDYNVPVITNNTRLLVSTETISDTKGANLPNNTFFFIQPNPADRTIVILPNEGIKDGNWKIKILDSQGRYVAAGSLSNQRAAYMPVDHLPSGLYFVQIVYNSMYVQTRKLIISH
jgi:uncharacterized repeat protein (TIGR01451 family)